MNMIFQQYWFDKTSLSVIIDAIVSNDIDGVLCVGTPTVFESLSTSQHPHIDTFLLDYDWRFVRLFVFMIIFLLLLDELFRSDKICSIQYAHRLSI